MTDQEREFAEWLKTQGEKPETPEAATPEPADPNAGAAPAAGEQGEPAAPDAPAANTETPEPFPGYNALPEEARKAIDDQIKAERARAALFEQQYNSLHGKVAPLQRKLADLEKKVAAPAVATPNEPTNAKPAGNTPAKPNQWERLRNELPDDAAAFEELVEARIQERLKELEPLKAKADVLAQFEERIRVEEEAAQLASEFPTWRETIDGDDFQDWAAAIRTTNPIRYQEIVSVLESKSAKEHARLLREFDLDLREVLLAERELSLAAPPAKPIKKPEPDPSPRSPAPAPSGQRFKTPEEEAFARWKAANPD